MLPCHTTGRGLVLTTAMKNDSKFKLFMWIDQSLIICLELEKLYSVEVNNAGWYANGYLKFTPTIGVDGGQA